MTGKNQVYFHHAKWLPWIEQSYSLFNLGRLMILFSELGVGWELDKISTNWSNITSFTFTFLSFKFDKISPNCSDITSFFCLSNLIVWFNSVYLCTVAMPCLSDWGARRMIQQILCTVNQKLPKISRSQCEVFAFIRVWKTHVNYVYL